MSRKREMGERVMFEFNTDIMEKWRGNGREQEVWFAP